MGLTISVNQQLSPLKINGHKVTEEDWDNMLPPSKDELQYRLFPERFEIDQDVYQQAEKYFCNYEVDWLNVGYASFNMFRHVILRNCNVKFFKGKAEVACDQDPEIKNIGLIPPFQPFYYHYDDKTYDKNDLHALEFLMDHSDCDGEYSNDEIKKLAQLIKDYPLKNKCKQYLQKCGRLEDYQEFIDFISKYAETNNCYFAFI